MPLSHFGEFDCDSTANWRFCSFQSLSAFVAHSQWVSVHSQWSRQRAKIFQFAVQSPWSRTAVSVESYCSLRGFAVHSPSNWRRLRCEPTETAVRLWRMQRDCAANRIRYNGNDVVDCFVINFILRNNEWWKGNGKINNSMNVVDMASMSGSWQLTSMSGSWHGFPGVDHEGRQDVAVIPWMSAIWQKSRLKLKYLAWS